MHPKRSPSRFVSQLLILALLAGHLPVARAGGNGEPLRPPAEVNLDAPVPQTSTTPLPFFVGRPFPSSLGAAPEPKPTSLTPPPSTSEDKNTCPTDASRKEVALCEAAIPSACKNINDFSMERRAGGLGKEILTWPAYELKANSEYGKKLQAFLAKNQNLYLNQLSATHNDVNQKSGNLQNAITARKAFFQAMFGTQGLPVGIPITCGLKRQIAIKVREVSTVSLKQDADPKDQNANACSGSFEKMYKLYALLQKGHNRLLLTLNDEIDGNQIKHPAAEPGKGEILFGGFPRLLQINAQMNKVALDEAKSKLSQDQQAKLKAEYDYLWTYNPKSQENLNKNGLYDQFVRQLKQEREFAKRTAEWLEQNKAVFADLEKRCGSLASPAARTTGAQQPGSDITGQNKPNASGASTAPPAAPSKAAKELPSPETQAQTPAATPAADTEPSTVESSVPPPYMPPPPEPNAAMTFLEDNWLWLLGGAGLVVGGVYLYKQHEKEEKQRKYWQNDFNFLPPPPPPPPPPQTVVIGASPNTVSGGSISPGTKLIFDTPPSGASVGQKMNNITLSLINADGMLQAVNGLAIEASCLTPNPCSLSGGKSVTSTGGKATFESLIFNQPDKGVVLQFSAPGVQSVTSSGTFDVQGSAPRQ